MKCVETNTKGSSRQQIDLAGASLIGQTRVCNSFLVAYRLQSNLLLVAGQAWSWWNKISLITCINKYIAHRLYGHMPDYSIKHFQIRAGQTNLRNP